MRIARIRISNFRAIKSAEIFPGVHNALLGPNNAGKTAVLEALNLLLNPEFSAYSHPIGENDFYRRNYLPSPPDLAVEEMEPTNSATPTPPLGEHISVEAILTDFNDEDEDQFREHLVPWDVDTRQESSASRSNETQDQRPLAGAVTHGS